MAYVQSWRADADKIENRTGIRLASNLRMVALLGGASFIAMLLLISLIYFVSEDGADSFGDVLLMQAAGPLRTAKSDQLGQAIVTAIADGARSGGTSYVELVGSKGEQLAGNLALRRVQPDGLPYTVGTGDGAPAPLRVIAWALPDGHQMVFAQDCAHVAQQGHRFLLIAFLGGTIALFGLAIGLVECLPGTGQRLRQLNVVAGRIAQGDLAARMPVTERSDALDDISQSINAMAAEIDRLMAQVRGATDAMAHDLRTPLTHLSGRLAKLQDELTPSGAEMMEGVLEEINAVLSRFTALLRITELEAGGRRATFVPVRAFTVLAGVIALYEPLAEEEGVAMTLEGSRDLLVRGDEALLFEAMTKIIDNALAHTPRGGSIALRCWSQNDRVAIEVRDNGKGMAPDEREAMLRRFRRGSAERTAPGAGLGLSLVAAVAHLHGFDLQLEDGSPGLVVRLVAPSVERMSR